MTEVRSCFSWGVVSGEELGGSGQAWQELEGCPEAPLLDFYMYRSQTDENYSPVNQDMANIGWTKAFEKKQEPKNSAQSNKHPKHGVFFCV